MRRQHLRQIRPLETKGTKAERGLASVHLFRRRSAAVFPSRIQTTWEIPSLSLGTTLPRRAYDRPESAENCSTSNAFPYNGGEPRLETFSIQQGHCVHIRSCRQQKGAGRVRASNIFCFLYHHPVKSVLRIRELPYRIPTSPCSSWVLESLRMSPQNPHEKRKKRVCTNLVCLSQDGVKIPFFIKHEQSGSLLQNASHTLETIMNPHGEEGRAGRGHPFASLLAEQSRRIDPPAGSINRPSRSVNRY
ncbi:hypothetical protein F4778DRAFT_430535 [Xylariomycetidae sp. FL2044]|nr:hypothetical protein F4778DRAFT_430535 [Xylariomycetidae sp. FL2044]